TTFDNGYDRYRAKRRNPGGSNHGAPPGGAEGHRSQHRSCVDGRYSGRDGWVPAGVATPESGAPEAWITCRRKRGIVSPASAAVNLKPAVLSIERPCGAFARFSQAVNRLTVLRTDEATAGGFAIIGRTDSRSGQRGQYQISDRSNGPCG